MGEEFRDEITAWLRNKDTAPLPEKLFVDAMPATPESFRAFVDHGGEDVFALHDFIMFRGNFDPLLRERFPPGTVAIDVVDGGRPLHADELTDREGYDFQGRGRRIQKWANLRIDFMVDQWKHVWMTQPRERVDLMTKTRLMRGVGTDRRAEEFDCEWRTVPISVAKTLPTPPSPRGRPIRYPPTADGCTPRSIAQLRCWAQSRCNKTGVLGVGQRDLFFRAIHDIGSHRVFGSSDESAAFVADLVLEDCDSTGRWHHNLFELFSEPGLTTLEISIEVDEHGQQRNLGWARLVPVVHVLFELLPSDVAVEPQPFIETVGDQFANGGGNMSPKSSEQLSRRLWIVANDSILVAIDWIVRRNRTSPLLDVCNELGTLRLGVDIVNRPQKRGLGKSHWHRSHRGIFPPNTRRRTALGSQLEESIDERRNFL